MKLLFRLTILALATGTVSISHAAEKTTAKPGIVKAKKSETNIPKKKRLGVDQSDFMPAANAFGVVVSYSASYNDLEQVDVKTVGHQVSVAGTYSFDKHWSAYSSIAASHETYGEKIYRENDKDDFHQLSNLNVGAVYNKLKPLSSISRSSNTLNFGLPVSERSRVDKHVANISLSNFMQSYGWKNITLFNRALVNYLWHTQKYSLFLDDRINRDFLLSNSVGINYMILPRVGIRYSVRANGVRNLDRSWNMSFGSNLSVFGNLYGVQIFGSYINNSYPENERIDISYYDKYRRLWMGGVTYVF